MCIILCYKLWRDFPQVSSSINTRQPEVSYLVGGQWVCSWPGAGRNMARARGGDFYWPRADWTKNRNQEKRVSGGEL